MAEAVRERKSIKYRKIDVSVEDIDNLPVVDDPLPFPTNTQLDAKENKVLSPVDEHILELPNETSNQTTRHDKCELDDALMPSAENFPSQLLSDGTLSDELSQLTYRNSVEESSTVACAPPLNKEFIDTSSAPLISSPILREVKAEFQLPICYSVKDLANFYTNQTYEKLDDLEELFIDEALCEALTLSVSIGVDDESQPILRPSLEEFKSPLHEHPLFRLLLIYAQHQLVLKSAYSEYQLKFNELQQLTERVWVLEEKHINATGKCHDGYNVELSYYYQTAELPPARVAELSETQKTLSDLLYKRLSTCSYNVAAARLKIEAYLTQVLKLCPAFTTFAQAEPILLLPQSNTDSHVVMQIRRLRTISSVLFAFLRQLSGAVQNNNEVINDITSWIMCITGRLVRQCRPKDHLYVCMQLLRFPFSIASSAGRKPPLSSLLQPPSLEVAWIRAEQRPVDFIIEAEVEVNLNAIDAVIGTTADGSVVSLATFFKDSLNRRAFIQQRESAQNDSERTDNCSNPTGDTKLWILLDSDGESDAECSANTSRSTTSSSNFVTPHLLPPDVGEDASLESIIALIDQIDIPGLVEFMFLNWDANGSHQNSLLPLFAFVNWIMSTLETAGKRLCDGDDDTAQSPRFQRRLAKRITEILCDLISGMRARIELIIKGHSSKKTRLYPDPCQPFTTHDETRLLMAQFDELCLRGAGILLMNVAAPETTRNVCWRRFARLTPLRVYSSKSKLCLYRLLVASASKQAGHLELEYCERRIVACLADEFSHADMTVNEGEAEATKSDASEVAQLLRSALLDTGALADAFVTALGRIAAVECRPPPVTDEAEGPLWVPTELPFMERVLVQRIVDLLFRLCVVPILNQPKASFEAMPVSATCGRDQLIGILTVHHTFAFRQVLDLVLLSAAYLDSRPGLHAKATKRPDLLSSGDPSELILNLVDALPLHLIIPTADDLSQLLAWIGGFVETELIPLHSLRSRVARKLLGNFPWEAVNNATGEPLISIKVQTRVAVAVATSFHRCILEAYRPPVSRLSETVTVYVKSVLPGVETHRRSSSHSPPRIRSSAIAIAPPVPTDVEAASLYHWAVRVVLRLRLEPSTGAITRLLSGAGQTNDGDDICSSNPIVAFLTLELQLRREPRPPIDQDEDACKWLHILAAMGHFSLAIEAFSRFSICQKASRSPMGPPCPAFIQFVETILCAHSSDAVSSSLLFWRFWSKKSSSLQVNDACGGAEGGGPVQEAFLGAVMNACLSAAGEIVESQALLAAVVTSTLKFLVSCKEKRVQAVWLLDRLVRMDFFLGESFPPAQKFDWWNRGVIKECQSTRLRQLFPEPPQVTNFIEDNFTSSSPNSSSNWRLPHFLSQGHRLMAASWAEGLSSLLASSAALQGLWAGQSGSIVGAEVLPSYRLLVELLQGGEHEEARGGVDGGGPFWLVACLIGANAAGEHGGYSQWDQVVDTITWNRSSILAVAEDKTKPTTSETLGSRLSSVFVEAGLPPPRAELSARLPIVQAIFALSACPFEHPAFFPLLQLALSHCFQFNRSADELKPPEGSADACFPPGFLLIRALQLRDSGLFGPVAASAVRLSILDAFTCRLKEALQFYLKKDSQDDPTDVYGLRSSHAVSFLRTSISLISDLTQTALHLGHDVLNANTLLERINSFDPSVILKSVNLDAIAQSVYTEISVWHSLRETYRPKTQSSRATTSQAGSCFEPWRLKPPIRRIDPPSLQQPPFKEAALFGPKDFQPIRVQKLVQDYATKIDLAASSVYDRSLRLEHLQKTLVENIIPRLYPIVNVHRSDVVQCQPLISIPLINRRPCAGGARITCNYKAASRDPAVEAELLANHKDALGLIEESVLLSTKLASLSCCDQSSQVVTSQSTAPLEASQEQEFVNRGDAQWVLAGFRLAAVLQRTIESRATLEHRSQRDVGQMLMGIFSSLCQRLSGPTHDFVPTKSIISQCVYMLAGDLLASGDCSYEFLLDTLARFPHLMLRLVSRIQPQQVLAHASTTPTSRLTPPVCRATQFAVFYRHLPLIFSRCGLKAAYDLLEKLDASPSPVHGSYATDSQLFVAPRLEQFGSAAELNYLITDAIGCLVEFNQKSDDKAVDLVKLLRQQLAVYLSINFPHTVEHIVCSTSSPKAMSSKAELWSTVKTALANDIASHNESSLSLDNTLSLLRGTSQCPLVQEATEKLTEAALFFVDCVGLLNQQLGAKLSRVVELNLMSLQNARKILNENLTSSIWPWVLNPDIPATFSVRPAVSQLSGVLLAIFRTKSSVYTPELLDALMDDIISRIFTISQTATASELLRQLIEDLEGRTEVEDNLDGFPWRCWRPSLETLKIITETLNGLLTPCSGRDKSDEKRSDALLSLVGSLSSVLSSISWGAQSSPAFSEGLLNLVVALVCAYDEVCAKRDTPMTCAADLQQLILDIQASLRNQRPLLRLSTSTVEHIKTYLRPSSIIDYLDVVYVKFFNFLTFWCHLSAQNREAHDSSEKDRPLYPALVPTSGGIPLSNFEVSRSRRAYIDLTVELLSSAFPDSKNTVTALQMAPLSKEESPSSEPTSTPARAYALLVNSLIPAASQAVGSVVTTVSSMPLWNRVFGLGGQSKDELDDTLQRLVGVHGPYRGFCWRVCCLLKEMETCFESAGWDPIDSETYSEAVSQCEQMLRLRLRDRTGPHTHENPYESSTALVDVAIAYWVSQDGVFSSAVSPPLPRALSRALHRPLLQALFFQLSEVSFSSGHQSKTSAAAGDGSNAAANTLSLTTIVNLIETCLWSFLQNDTKTSAVTITKASSSSALDLDTRMARLHELFLPTKERGRLCDCVSWLIPACLTCGKLLPLVVHALARQSRIVFGRASVAASSSSSSSSSPDGQPRRSVLRSSESPAILLADIMHWLVSVDLQPSNVCARNCAESSQLTALLLLFHLAIQQLVSIGSISLQSRATHFSGTSQTHRLINYFRGLSNKWSKLVSTSNANPDESAFIKKYCQMSECIVAILEEWSEPALTSSETETTSRGIQHLRNMVDNSISGEIVAALLARLEAPEGGLADVLSCQDVVQSYTFLCQQFWSPLHEFMSNPLTDHPP